MKIAVLGAGIGGLTAAFSIRKKGHEVTVFEQESKPGGLAAGFKEEDWNWSLEKYYHHWFRTDRAILSLIDELGLSDQVRFYRPKTVVYHQGDFYPLDSPVSALKFPGFSLVEKIRFGIITVFLKYFSRWEPLEKYTACEWVKRYYGKNLFKVFFEPLLIGKFSDYYQEVNMAWFWARFKARSTKLGTFKGGFQTFLDKFAELLSQKGVRFSFNSMVSKIISLENGKIEISVNKKKITFDMVLATISPKILSSITPQLKGEYVEKINVQESIGSVVIVLSLKNQLSEEGYYWYNLPKSAGFPFLALVEHTNYVSSDNYNGEHLIYCGDYLEPSHKYFYLNKEELIENFIPSLKKINPSFKKDWINKSWLFRTPYAQPIPRINHSRNLLNIRTPLSGLFLASMSQVYPWDRGTNYAVSFANQAVQEILTPKTYP